MKEVMTYTTGSHRGYVSVANRGAETAPHPIPSTLTGLRGNYRWAMAALRRAGCTHYTIAAYQGVPGKGYSNQYCYDVYTGYAEEQASASAC